MTLFQLLLIFLRGFGDGIAAYVVYFYLLFKLLQVVFTGNSVNFFFFFDDFALTSVNFS